MPVQFTVAPVLHEDFGGLEGQIIVYGNGAEKALPLKFVLPKGEKVFAVGIGSRGVYSSSTTYCTNIGGGETRMPPSGGKVKGEIEGLHKNVIKKLYGICKPLTVTSGRRKTTGRSAHNHGLAADITIPGLSTSEIADLLKEAGFTGIGEYYNKDGTPTNFAHGDIRGQTGSEGTPYNPDGSLAKPARWKGQDEGSGPGKRKWKYD